jgi:nitrile hydratase
VPEEVDIAVWDSTAETRYLVLPARPDGTGSLAEDELAALVTRDGLIGTARV